MSGAMDSRFRAVSSRISPLDTLLVDAEKFRMSALSLFSASSKDDRVRVEGSKNRLITVFPRSVGTFLTGLAAAVLQEPGYSRLPGLRFDRSRPGHFLQHAAVPEDGLVGPPPAFRGVPDREERRTDGGGRRYGGDRDPG